MDPVGPWYASYNRLAGVTGVPGVHGVQAPPTPGDFHHHHGQGVGVGVVGPGVGVSSSSSPNTSSAGQLLLQAAHTTALAATGQLTGTAASAFNTTFLSPPTVGYDAVFSPLFHHANPKPAHYSSTINAQHRQALAQAQANNKNTESDLNALRENYAQHHQQAFFEQSAAGGAAAAGTLAWQAASPFGILPHETVVPSSPGALPAATAKVASAAYDGFGAHFAAQGLNSVGKARAGSPQVPAPAKGGAPSQPPSGGFFQTPAAFAEQEQSQQQDYKQRTNATTATGTGASQQPSGVPETAKITDSKKLTPTTGVGSGFMASYLKFLQGERDTSPPPATRGGRKATWSRSNLSNNSKSFNSNAQSDSKSGADHAPANGALNAIASNSSQNSASGLNLPMSSAMNANMLSNIPKDDDRYFPIPKDRKRKFDGTEESYEDEDRRKPVLNVPSTPLNNDKGGNKKGRGAANRAPAVIQPMASSAVIGTKKPRPVQSEPTAQQQYYYQQPSEESVPDTSRRRTKRFNVTQLGCDDDNDGLPDFFDSDSDPAWTPQPKDEEDAIQDEAGQKRKVKRSRPSASNKRSNILSAAAHGAGIDYADYSSEEESNVKKLNQQRAIQQLGQQTINRQPEEMPYQPGEFLVIKSELIEAWPSIWRVDGKSLLQKYEPFEQGGKVLYKNISTYSAWNPDNKKLYMQVPVRYRVQTTAESIVELLRNEIVLDDNDFIVKRMQETIVYQDNFEVYIQTLISHALDPNFLTEIFQEQDEYFLTNVKTVDDITEERARRIVGSTWTRGLEMALAAWPCLSSTDLGSTISGIMCVSCRTQRGQNRIQLYGQPYDPATLERRQPDPRYAYEKEAILCRGCCQRAELYSRVTHQKYLMFLECNKRVEDKRIQDPHKDTTLILNELLADEPWLSQLFRDVRQSWAEAESMERKTRQNMSRQHM